MDGDEETFTTDSLIAGLAHLKGRGFESLQEWRENFLVQGQLSVLILISVLVLRTHTPSIAFRNLPPNSARFSYATEGALFISAQLSSDAVSALRKVRVLI